MIDGVDYFVRIVKFPKGTTHGAVALNDDGTYSVYIDANATEEQKKTAYEHEIAHIDGDDMYGEKSITEIEDGLESEERGYFESWIDWMEWCRREMRKKGIKPMEL